jgi:hypothetical protein
MGLLSRFPTMGGGMAAQLDPRMLQQLSPGAMTQLYGAMQPQAMPPQVDPSLAAYGQTENGKMAYSPQAANDAAAAAYGGGTGMQMNPMAMMAFGQSMMNESEPKMQAPPPPQFLDPYRFRRRGA